MQEKSSNLLEEVMDEPVLAPLFNLTEAETISLLEEWAREAKYAKEKAAQKDK